MSELKKLIKWGVLSFLIGLLGGSIGAGFRHAIAWVTTLRGAHPWLIYTLPVVGVIIVFLYQRTEGDWNTDRVILAVHGEKHVPLLLAPLIFISTVLSHFAGASVGREGAALQLGGSIGSFVSRTGKCSKDETRVLVMAGMASVFSALFGTPLAAAFFAMEVAVCGRVYYSAILPCMVSSLTAFRTAVALGAEPERFSVVSVPSLSVPFALQVTVLAVLCALVSIVFCKTIRAFETYGAKWCKNPYLRVVLGGALLIVMTMIFSTDYNGGGSHIIERAFHGEVNPEAALLKLIFTALSLAAGFKGGEIVPSFFVGATFGGVVGTLIGLPTELAAAIGFVSVFCGAVNCPTASILLAVEAFSGQGVLVFAYVCVISYLLSGNTGLYSAQKRSTSKLEEHWV